MHRCLSLAAALLAALLLFTTVGCSETVTGPSTPTKQEDGSKPPPDDLR